MQYASQYLCHRGVAPKALSAIHNVQILVSSGNTHDKVYLTNKKKYNDNTQKGFYFHFDKERDLKKKKGRKQKVALLVLHLIRVAVPAQNDIWHLANWTAILLISILKHLLFPMCFVHH